MARLVMNFLGGFEVQKDGIPLYGFETDKTRALLAYLAVESGYPHRRDRLANLFWPERSEEAAHTNLRGALSNLRQALGEGKSSWDGAGRTNYLQINRDTVQFNLDSDVWLDVSEFERTCQARPSEAEIDAVQAAVGLVRGHFLEGLTCKDCPEFDDWAYFVRERLQHLASTTLSQLADYLESRGEFAQAIQSARRRVELEPWQEDAHFKLMRLLTVSGERSSAIAQYEICCRRLEDELGVEPAEETRMLYEAIMEGRLSEPGEPERDLLPALGKCPFKGLKYFDEDDAGMFFGRENLTARLVKHLQNLFSAPENGRCLVVVGASGSGKSSVVRAGLAAAVKKGCFNRQGTADRPGPGGESVQTITPTADPLAVLERVEAGEAPCFLLIVDQFEEVFTLCKNESSRKEFIERLLSLKRLVVITLRADFYAHCAAYPELRRALCDHQEYIGEMNAAELRRAIVEPARQNGWTFDPGLEDLILRDTGVSSDRPPEPGALPLLEHALLETWLGRSGRRLTLKGYSASGGVYGAIAKTAERVFSGLDETQRIIIRRIFLRLTELGEGTQDTRRRVSFDELANFSSDTQSIQDLLKILADARLITLSEGDVEVAHEAIIREWPALCAWLNDDRESLRLHRHLTESVQAWQKLGWDSDELYHGVRLVQAVEWAQDGGHHSELNSLEQEFLEASQTQARLEAYEREMRIQKELEATRQLLALERQRASEAQKNYARELAAQAELKLSSEPELCLLLALESAAIWKANGDLIPWQLQQLLHHVLETNRLLRAITDMSEQSWNLAYNPNGGQIAVYSGLNKIRFYDPLTWQTLGELGGMLAGMAYSPDGRHLAAATIDLTVVVLDTQTLQTLLTVHGFDKSVWSVDYSKDGNYLAAGCDNAIATIWDLKPWREAGCPADSSLDQPKLSIPGFRFTPWFSLIKINPDGQTFATTTEENTVILWDLQTGEQRHVLVGQNGAVVGLAFNPQGTRLATANEDYSVRLWDTATGKEVLRLTGHSHDVARVSFSPDGSHLASSANDGLIILWDAVSGRRLFDLVARMPVHELIFSPDGKRLITTHEDYAIRVWDVSREGRGELAVAPIFGDLPGGRWSSDRSCFACYGGDHRVHLYETDSLRLLNSISVPVPTNTGDYSTNQIAISTAGTLLAIAARSAISLWDTTSGEKLWDIPHTEQVVALAFSQDGRRLAAGGDAQWVDLWDVEDLERLKASYEELHQQLPVAMYGIRTLAFSPDGALLAASGCETDHLDGLVYLWKIGERQKAASQLRVFLGDTMITHSISFSADRKFIATGGFDQHVEVWDVESGARLLQLVGHTSGIETIDFSPDGKYILTASDDRTARVWDREDGTELLCYTLPGAVVCAFFTSDGRRVVLIPETGGIRLNCFLNIDELAELAHSRLTRDLKPEERKKYLHPGEDLPLP